MGHFLVSYGEEPFVGFLWLQNREILGDPCKYYLNNAFIDEITGLSAFSLEDLGVSGQYVEGSSYDETAVKYSLAVRTCPVSLQVKASAVFKQDGGSNTFSSVACTKINWKVELKAEVTFQVSELIAWAQATFQKIFAGDSDALSGGVESLVIDIQYLKITKFDISNFPGDAQIKNLANDALKAKMREKLSETISAKLKNAMDNALAGAMVSVGSKMPSGGESRRLATCPSSAPSGDAVLIDSAKRQYWASLSLLFLAFLAHEIA